MNKVLKIGMVIFIIAFVLVVAAAFYVNGGWRIPVSKPHNGIESEKCQNEFERMTCSGLCLDGYGAECYLIRDHGNPLPDDYMPIGIPDSMIGKCIALQEFSHCHKCKNEYFMLQDDVKTQVSCTRFYFKLDSLIGHDLDLDTVHAGCC